MNEDFLKYLLSIRSTNYLLIWSYICSLKDKNGIAVFSISDICIRLKVKKHDVHNAVKKIKEDTQFISEEIPQLYASYYEAITKHDRGLLVINFLQDEAIRQLNASYTPAKQEQLPLPEQLKNVYNEFDKETISILNNSIIQVIEKVIPNILQIKAKQKYLSMSVQKVKTKQEQISELVKEIVDYLNEKTKKEYRHDTPNTINLINALLNKGYKVEQFKKVIDNKVMQWLNDIENSKYLRPETLFGSKFDSYLNEDSINRQMLLGRERSISKECVLECLAIFNALYIEKNNTAFIPMPNDENNIYEFLIKIKKKMEEGKLVVSETELLKNAKLFLSKIDDNWILNNLSPSILNTKFNEIYVSVKSKNKGTAKGNQQEFNERFKDV